MVVIVVSFTRAAVAEECYLESAQLFGRTCQQDAIAFKAGDGHILDQVCRVAAVNTLLRQELASLGGNWRRQRIRLHACQLGAD